MNFTSKSYKWQGLIDEIKSRVSIIELIGEDTPLQPNGKAHVGWHQTHGSKSGTSLHVDEDTGLYFCFNCGEGGDCFTWLMQNRAMSFIDAVRELSARVGLSVDISDEDQERYAQTYRDRNDLAPVLLAAADFYAAQLADEHRKDMANRWGLTGETIAKYKIGYAPVSAGALRDHLIQAGFARELLAKSGLFWVNEGGRLGDFFRGRITIPYFHNNQVVYMIGRWFPGCPDDPARGKYKKQLVHSAGRPWVSPAIGNDYFYGEDSAVRAKELLITEGVADCLAALQAGFACVSPVTVRFKKADHPKILSLSRRVDRVLICNDQEASAAGEAGALATATFLETAGVQARLITLPRPEGVDKIDLAEYLRDHSAEDLRALFAAARSCWEVQVERLPVPGNRLEAVRVCREYVTGSLAAGDELTAYWVIKDALKTKFKLDAESIKTLIKAHREAAKERQDKDAAKTGVDTFAGNLVQVAPGYWCDKDKPLTIEETTDGKKILMNLSVLPARFVEQDESSRHLEARILTAARPYTVVLPAGFPTSRKAGEILAESGVSVNIRTLRALQDVVAEIFNARGDLPAVTATGRLGWHGGRFVTGLSEAPVFVPPPGLGRLRYYGTTVGGEDEARATWREILNEARVIPALAAGLGHTIGSVLLHVVDPDDAKDLASVLHFSSASTRGKTSIVKVGAATCGPPGKLVGTWDSTRVAIEQLFGALGNMPAFADELSLANAKVAVATVFGTRAGEGRKRGRAGGGLRDTATWQLNLVSTGEIDLISLAAQAGIRARVITVTSAMPDAATADKLVDLAEGAAGWPLRWFIEAINTDEVTKAWRESLKYFTSDDPISNRKGKVFALNAVALHLVARVTGGDLDLGDCIGLMLAVQAEDAEVMAQAGGSEADLLYESVVNVLALNPDAVLTVMADGGWAGRQPAGGYLVVKKGAELLVTADKLRRIAKDAGIDDAGPAVRALAAQGRVLRGDGRHLAQLRRISGVQLRAYVFRMPDEAEEEPPKRPGGGFFFT